jgi:hypothetical protein
MQELLYIFIRKLCYMFYFIVAYYPVLPGYLSQKIENIFWECAGSKLLYSSVLLVPICCLACMLLLRLLFTVTACCELS